MIDMPRGYPAISGFSLYLKTLRIVFVSALTLLCAEARSGDESRDNKEAKKIYDVLNAEQRAEYRIFALRIGVTDDASRNLFIADPSLPKRIEVAFSFWVIKGSDRLIVVDTGFRSKEKIERWRIEKYKDPLDALAEAGIRPEQVTDVVLTHGHWDHIGGIGLFPNARIWINQKELKSLRNPKTGKLPKNLRGAERESRLKVTSSVESIAPQVVVVPVGLHTPGFQYVVVNNNDGIWILASDIAPLYANFERQKPSGQTSDPERAVAVQDTMVELVKGDLKRIVPGHEPSIYDKKDINEINKP
jgi:glyoxylase-like metal-dependent hydrolase (beta-lactamase superfamily II)